MTITLQDPVGPRDPSASHAFREVVSEPSPSATRTLAEELLSEFRGGRGASETSFQLASHGGYARTVVGTVAYLDEQAQTFLVRGRDGGLIRVPLRDVTSIDIKPSSDPARSNFGGNLEGLGGQAGGTVHARSR
jgi:hypothetical protein